jgi:acyl carrier protein
MIDEKPQVDEKLQGVLRSHLPEATQDGPLAPDSTLVDLGIDSLRLVEFIIALEDSFQIAIPDEEMLANNFNTVGTVSTLVNRILTARS